MPLKHGTGIEWTHVPGYTGVTWNPTTGCSIVSTECAHCYAAELSLRRGWSSKPWTPANAAENVILHPDRLDRPRHWTKPRAIFVNSMSDLFHEQIPSDFVWSVLDVARDCPRHLFLILTKRPERMRRLVNAWYALSAPLGDAPPLPNLWMGVSIGLRHFIRRADVLRQVHASVRFISAEPLIGSLVRSSDGVGCACGWPLDRCSPRFAGDGRCGRKEQEGPHLDLTDIHWVIAGGESGSDHRPMDLAWVRDLRDECLGRDWRCECGDLNRVSEAFCYRCGSGQPEAGERGGRPAFFYKQFGGRTPKAGGRELDGRTWSEFPGGLELAAPSGTLF